MMKMLRFEPKEDITVYELAQIVKLDTLITSESIQGLIPEEGYRPPSTAYLDALPENVRRHLVIRDE